jgi:hypothetical protein
MGKRIDIIGITFNKLTALRYVGNSPRGALHECVCSCGNRRICAAGQLRAGQVKSCLPCAGKHGKLYTPEYKVWSGMVNRCTNPNNHGYKKYYGVRGITVCDEWRSFESFYKDMAPRPSLAHQLDRIDNDKGYFKENCRWATAKENTRNRRGCSICNCRCSMNRMKQEALKKESCNESGNTDQVGSLQAQELPAPAF